MKKQLSIFTLLILATTSSFAQLANFNFDNLPENKKSKSNLYLTPEGAYEMKTKNAQSTAFFDIRTRAEAVYVGMPEIADALIPYMEHQDGMTEWDNKKNSYILEPNSDFLLSLDKKIKEMGLNKESKIILICRSGDRSAKAQDLLNQAGYKNVYGIPEGFEGDTKKDNPKSGQRVVNGWKNANLPWTYKLEKSKMYFPN